MKRIFSILLFSSLLLGACGQDSDVSGEEIEEDVVEEVGLVEEEVTEEETFESEEESTVHQLTKGYFYSHTRDEIGPDIENRIEDTTDIMGIYVANTPMDLEERYVLPETVLLEVNHDGSFTWIKFTNPKVEFDASTNSIVDLSFQEYIEQTSRDDRQYMESEANRLTNEKTQKASYIDDNNQLKWVEGYVPTFSSIEIQTGYMVEAFGKKQLMGIEQKTVNPNFSSEGKLEYSEVINVTNGEENFGPSNVSALLEGFGTVFDEEIFTLINSADILHDVFLLEGKLKSASQVQKELFTNASNKEYKKVRDDFFQNSDIYFDHPNEVMHNFIRKNLLKEVLTDTDEFIGYTEDNRELSPDIVFLNGTNYYALFEKGEFMKFDTSDSTWHREHSAK